MSALHAAGLCVDLQPRGDRPDHAMGAYIRRHLVEPGHGRGRVAGWICALVASP